MSDADLSAFIYSLIHLILPTTLGGWHTFIIIITIL